MTSGRKEALAWFLLALFLGLVVWKAWPLLNLEPERPPAGSRFLPTRQFSDVPYCTRGDKKLLMDISAPSHGTGPWPALIVVHGGAWEQGSRQSMHFVLQQAARRGYVAASLQYRLARGVDRLDPNNNALQQAVDDVRCGVEWMVAHAEQQNVDPNAIALMGWSAGAHAALMVGLAPSNNQNGEEAMTSPTKSPIRAVINFAGMTDANLQYNQRMERFGKSRLPFFMGATPEERPDLYARLSPVKQLDPADPPILTIHGEKDTTVFIDQARVLDEAARASGTHHELLTLPEAGHVLLKDDNDVALKAMFAFLKRWMTTPAPAEGADAPPQPSPAPTQAPAGPPSP